MKNILRKLKRCVKRPYRFIENIERMIAYRTYEKYHIIKTGLRPGYYDVDERMLHANFALLVDFVEIECAAKNWFFDESNRPKKLSDKLLEMLNRLSPVLRSVERGVDYVDWRTTRESVTVQDRVIPELEEERKYWEDIKRLYIWWKFERPDRRDPYEASGYSQMWDELRLKYPGGIHYFVPVANGCLEMKNLLSEDEDKKFTAFALSAHQTEERYRKEDNEMLQLLVRVRDFLWS